MKGEKGFGNPQFFQKSFLLQFPTGIDELSDFFHTVPPDFKKSDLDTIKLRFPLDTTFSGAYYDYIMTL